MIQVLYDFPLPNNGDRYDLSEDELKELLQNAYNNGYNTARNQYDVHTSSAAYVQEEAISKILR